MKLLYGAIAVAIQTAGVVFLFLVSALAVGGDGSAGGVVFVNFLNLLVVAYTGVKAWRYFSKHDNAAAIGISLTTVPLAFGLYFLLGIVLFVLRSFGVAIG